MKICINLQPINDRGAGIATFTSQLVSELIKFEELVCYGCVNYVRNMNREKYAHFPMKITYSPIPYKLIYSRKIKQNIPIPYTFISRIDVDVNLFFTYKIPRVSYHGITVCTIHDLIPLKTDMESSRIAIDYINDVTYSASKSDYILTVSENSKQDIVNYLKIEPDKVRVIPNGVDFCKFNTPISSEKKYEVRHKYNLPTHYILYMGGMRKHKNVEMLINAYGFLPEKIREKSKLVITVGTDNLRSLVCMKGLEKYVVFIPFVDEADKVAVYQMADVFSFISLYEGFGIPVLEAQASSIPVLTSNTSSLPEISGKNGAILVDPNNIEDISNGLNLLITSKEVRESCIQAGLENAKKYSWENAGNLLFSFLKEIAHKDNV